MGFQTFDIPENKPLNRGWWELYYRELLEEALAEKLDRGAYELLLPLYERRIATRWCCTGHQGEEVIDPITGEVKDIDNGYLAIHLTQKDNKRFASGLAETLIRMGIITDYNQHNPKDYTWYLYFLPGGLPRLINVLTSIFSVKRIGA
jgi:hypothetical protein